MGSKFQSQSCSVGIGLSQPYLMMQRMCLVLRKLQLKNWTHAHPSQWKPAVCRDHFLASTPSSSFQEDRVLGCKSLSPIQNNSDLDMEFPASFWFELEIWQVYWILGKRSQSVVIGNCLYHLNSGSILTTLLFHMSRGLMDAVLWWLNGYNAINILMIQNSCLHGTVFWWPGLGCRGTNWTLKSWGPVDMIEIGYTNPAHSVNYGRHQVTLYNVQWQ